MMIMIAALHVGYVISRGFFVPKLSAAQCAKNRTNGSYHPNQHGIIIKDRA
jgi:hypothetical protein